MELGGRNQGMVPLEFGCTLRLVQEFTVKVNSSVVLWLAHSVVATKVGIQISE